MDEVKHAMQPPQKASLTPKEIVDGQPKNEPPRPPASKPPPSLEQIHKQADQQDHFQYQDGWSLGRVISEVINGLGKTVVFIVQDYVDFFRELATYDGSWSHLFQNLHFLYRALVTALITIGLIEIAPLMGIIGQIGSLLVKNLTKAIRWGMVPIEWAVETIEWMMWDAVKYARRMITNK